MSFREAFGLALVVIGLVLIPAAWTISRPLWLVAFVLFVIGVALFYSERMQKKEEALEKEGGSRPCTGPILPTDINDYTGWSTGGRSETMDSASYSDSSGVD